MKKVLVIAYLYPPIFNSGTRRSLEFVNNLPDHGWTPTVLTVEEPAPEHCDPALLAEVRPGTQIARAPSWGNHVGKKLGRMFASVVDPDRVAKAVKWRVDRWWNVPDGVASWAPTAVQRGLELHARERFDVIYASGWPWTSFLVAEKLSRLTGVPYVVDYRDLWKPGEVAWDNSTWLQRQINPFLERRVLRRAAGVISTTKTFLTLLPQAILPKHRFAITNGFSEGDFEHAAGAAAADDTVRIVYTGVWRPGYGPDDLYQAVKELKSRGVPGLARLKLVMAGFPPGKAAEYGITEFVEEHGRVTHADAVGFMSSADALYLPVSKGLYEYASIPGKLFEYMASGRPILASALATSEVASVLADVGGAARLEPGDVGALANAIELLCQGKQDNLFSPRLPEQLAKYKRSNLTHQLALALQTVSQPQQHAAHVAGSGQELTR